MEQARRVLRHGDTARCAQGALMVAQELLRSQQRVAATGVGPSLRSHAQGLGQVADFFIARFAPSLVPDLAPEHAAAAGTKTDTAMQGVDHVPSGQAYADIDMSDFEPKVQMDASASPSGTSTVTPQGPPQGPAQPAASRPATPPSGLVDDDIELPTTAGKEQAVPSGPLSRVVGFSRLAAGLAAGTVSESVRRGFGAKREEDNENPSRKRGMRDAVLSDANSDRIAATLCRMRGAALKLGQMLSIQDETVLPPQLSRALERVRQSADIMPSAQLDKVLRDELGADWRDNFVKFNNRPFAAASLGQVHQALLKTESGPVPVAVKVQFPGVADSIDSDLNNLKRLADVTGIFPRGLFIDRIVEVMKEELREECDYLAEAEHQMKFRDLLKDDSDAFFVPRAFKQTTTSRVLTTELARGVPIDKVVDTLSQEKRNRIGRLLLRLSLKELFEFRYMQTDPNFSNYMYDDKTGRVVLLDFGATRAYGREFVDDYMELVWAASNSDRAAILDYSVRLGFLTGDESQAMKNAHIHTGLEIGRPFQHDEPFDFRGSRMVNQMSKHGGTFMNERLTPPPKEVYSLHRKLSGAYMTCIKLGAIFPCRDLLVKTYNNAKAR
ncbi:Atypical kinase COQ8A, mitochondrial [Hondaea fermentalgiana]|uniref:Atypical kinase COQ8A, mitochondrial n=1 Tax=Hondaea fermentalgiana TaxID=2315210 RepID=A0A2R5GFK7_9STRA|nr:Atypical kinase COQ8A, mitochondrial [Hondaea fermentalgiana]|eukprot:GBG28548.1 Atypical kinase COQ8A, mitochondrial [Hondaea fermentalgiana]